MKTDAVILYETPARERFYPFSTMHCTWEIRCGATRLFEKVRRQFPEARIIYMAGKKHLKSFLARNEHDAQSLKKEHTLVLNAEVVLENDFRKRIDEAYDEITKDENEEKAVIFVNRPDVGYPGEPFAIYLPSADIINPIEFDKSFLPGVMMNFYDKFPKAEIANVKILRYMWDAIKYNGEMIKEDAHSFHNKMALPGNFPAAHFINKNNIITGGDVKIAPGVVIDASEGPVIIDDRARIMANSVVTGPCYIGKDSVIKAGAKIYEDTSIGETCKVGGEVEASVIHAYSNKQHEGFLGHSYLGEWVNIGADTNTSDLKNTYSDIKVMLDGMELNTGSMFLGLICGDHTKTAINTSFTTGTIAGLCGILVHDGTLPREIPSFAWTGRKNSPIYKLSKAIEVAKTVMARRNRELLPEEEDLLAIEHKRVEEKYYK